MKTAITIHIANRVFTIDEDAHTKLDQYLNQLRTYFAKDATEEESAEIIADIENRIGEILEERLGENRAAVNMEDVEYITKEMGTVEDIAKEDESAGESKAEAPASTDKNSEEGNWKPGKKLYRDPDQKVIGGVCAGLAAYFDVDVTFFRIAFLILLLINGIGLLAYAILWIAMPEAETAAEKAAMKGKRANISNIEKNVKERLAKGLTEEDRAKARTGVQKFYDALRQLFQGAGRVVLAVLKVLAVVLAIGLSIGGFLVLAAGSAIFVQIWVGAPETVSVGPITHILGATGDLSRPVLISAYATIVFFGLFLMFVANSIFRKGKGAYAWLTTLFFVLFFIAATVTANLGLRYWPEIEKSYNEYNESVTAVEVYEELAAFESIEVGGAVELDVTYAETQRVELVADANQIDQYEVVVENGVLRLKRADWKDWCLFWCYSRPTQLHVQVPELSGVQVSGASDAYIHDMPAVEYFEITAQGASDVEAIIDAERFAVYATGSSGIMIEGVGTDILAEASGASQIVATYVTGNTNVDLSGSSDFVMIGETDRLYVEASGASHVEGDFLKAQDVIVNLSGSSSVLVQAHETLTVDASGASTVRYYGSPIVNADTSGSSSVTPMKSPAPDVDRDAIPADAEEDEESEVSGGNESEEADELDAETDEEIETSDGSVDNADTASEDESETVTQATDPETTVE